MKREEEVKKLEDLLNIFCLHGKTKKEKAEAGLEISKILNIKKPVSFDELGDLARKRLQKLAPESFWATFQDVIDEDRDSEDALDFQEN